MEVLIIIGFCILILVFLIFSVIISKKRMSREVLKIEEADNNIDLYLEKKKQLLDKAKSYFKEKEEFSSYEEISFDEIDHIRTNEVLDEYNQKLEELIDFDEELMKNAEFQILLRELTDNNCNLYGSIKFYNDSVEKYFALKKKFPTRLFKVFCGFRNYDSYVIKTSKGSIY